MTDYKLLAQMLSQGIKPVVTFKSGIDDKEGYPSANMRARIIGISSSDPDDLFKLTFDYDGFEGINIPLEPSNYWDKNKKPCLTCKEAGYYTPQELLYFDVPEPLDSCFTV